MSEQLIPHLIHGQRTDGGSRSQPVFNPATGRSSKSVQLADQATLEAAVASAQQAFPAWRDTPPNKRAQVMQRFKVLLEQKADAICALITDEHGKVLADALGELQRGIENVEYAGYAPELLKGEHSKNVGPQIDSWSEFQPLGVVAGITPFNFPAMVPLWMWPMAVVCGNTLPCSSVISVQIFSAFCSSNTLKRCMICARLFGGVSRQAGNACWAEATAASNAAWSASRTALLLWPVAGLNTGWLRLPPSVRSPWIRWVISCSLMGFPL